MEKSTQDVELPEAPMTGRYEHAWINRPQNGALTLVADYWSTFGPIDAPLDFPTEGVAPAELALHYTERGAYYVRVYARDENDGSIHVFTTVQRTPLS